VECSLGWGPTRETLKVEFIAKVKAFNKQSVRLHIYSASSMETLKGSISGMEKKTLQAALKDSNKSYWSLSQVERKEILEGIEIPNLEATIGYQQFVDWAVFETSDIPFVVGHEYISPKFKKEYFNA